MCLSSGSGAHYGSPNPYHHLVCTIVSGFGSTKQSHSHEADCINDAFARGETRVYACIGNSQTGTRMGVWGAPGQLIVHTLLTVGWTKTDNMDMSSGPEDCLEFRTHHPPKGYITPTSAVRPDSCSSITLRLHRSFTEFIRLEEAS